jgi:RNA polymerase sigma factor FliA
MNSNTGAAASVGGAPGGPGDARAKRERELAELHLPLVGYIVNEFRMKVPRHVPVDDLRSAAMTGLALATRSWDPERGIPFERFAASRIRGAVLDELRSTDWASRSVRSRSRAVRNATDTLTGQLGRSPSNPEVAAHLGLSAAEMQKLTVDIHRSVVIGYESLPGAEQEEQLPTAALTPEASVIERERTGYLHDAIAELPDRLRRVVVGCFFEELPMAALAEELRVSASRVSQMRAEALALIGEALRRQLDSEVVYFEPPMRAERRKAAYYSAVAARRSCRERLSDAPRLVPR